PRGAATRSFHDLQGLARGMGLAGWPLAMTLGRRNRAWCVSPQCLAYPAPTESEALMRTILYIALLAAVGCGQKDEKPAEPDNTEVNERDRDDEAKTPLDQNENSEDIEITANIRKALMNQDGFSVAARNIKVITADG